MSDNTLPVDEIELNESSKAIIRSKILDNVHIEPYSGCWFWGKSINSRGYGCFCWDQAVYSAHRVSYLAFIGPILSRGSYICHKCDERSCVNPGHLFEGSPSDNMNDMYKKGRHKSPLSGKRDEILSLMESGLSVRSIAKKMGVNHGAINLRLKSWKSQ